jgi:K+-transporting ATPase ATPase C chain
MVDPSAPGAEAGPPAPGPSATGGRSEPREPPYRPPSGRAAIALVLLFILLTGFAYPALVTGVAQGLDPASARGSLRYGPGGTLLGSYLLGDNITNRSLFWLRPAATDYLPFSGAGNVSLYGPTDPALRNETLREIALYGLENTSPPIDLVGPSASGLEPFLTPGAVLVQIPRVSWYSHLNQTYLMALVNAYIEPPIGGFFGPPLVNVITLDMALLQAQGEWPPPPGSV